MTALLLASLVAVQPFVEASATPRPTAGAAGKKVDRRPRVNLLIWGGGKTPADAQAAVADFASRGFTSSESVATFLSTDVEGLKPGFHIAVLGACPRDRAFNRLWQLRTAYPDVYLRQVPMTPAITALRCPKFTVPARDWFEKETGRDQGRERTATRSAMLGDKRLSVQVTEGYDTNGEYESYDWDAVATLRRGSEVLGTWKESRGSFSQVEDLEVDGAALVFRASEAISSCVGSSFYEVIHVTRRLTILGDEVAVDAKVDRRESGLCGPDAEGADPCDFARQRLRYDGASTACANATREACDKAIAKLPDEEPEACRSNDDPGDSPGD